LAGTADTGCGSWKVRAGLGAGADALTAGKELKDWEAPPVENPSKAGLIGPDWKTCC